MSSDFAVAVSDGLVSIID